MPQHAAAHILVSHLKNQEEILEREEVERTKAALQLKAQSKQEHASRRRADKSETLRIQRESYNLVKAAQQKEVRVCPSVCGFVIVNCRRPLPRSGH